MTGRLPKLVFLFSIGVFFISSYIIFQRYQNQELWGYLPLFQFTSAWFVLGFLVKRRWWQDEGFVRKVGLATLSAVLLTLGFPPFPIPLPLFVGFVPLLLALDYGGGEQSSGHRFFLLFHTFVLWNIFSTFWVANTAFLAGIFANVVNAFLMTLPCLLALFIVRHLGKNVALLSFIFCWLTFEFLHMRWELYWPWLTLGNGLAEVHFGIQWYDTTGVFGGSLWILLINVLVYQLIRKQEAQKLRTRDFTMLTVWTIVPLAISLGIYFTYTSKGELIEVVSVQPNFEPHYEKFVLNKTLKVRQSLELAKGAITSSTDYVIFPETNFSGVDLDNTNGDPSLLAMQSFAAEHDVNILSGLAGIRFLTDDEDIHLPTTHTFIRDDGPLYVEQYNCAVQIDPEGRIQEYYKALYVPGAEYFPFKKVLYFLKPIVDQLGGTLHGYRVREYQNVFSTDVAVVSPTICYESIFGEYNADLIKKGSEVIFVMTNDGWWDNTPGHKQHADYARLRAIEGRRDVVRSANMGTCCIIDQRGRMSQQTVYGHADAINVKAKKNTHITFYVKWGDMLGRISLFLTLIFAARSLVARFRPS